mgnify:FL=1
MGIRRGSISTPIIADGLVFNMDAANRASYPRTGTIVTDTISSLISGSFVNSPLYESPTTSSFSFDGVDDYITVSNNSIFDFGSDDWTCSVWGKFNVTKNASYYNLIIGQWEGGSNNQSSWAISFHGSTGALGFSVFYGSAAFEFSSNTGVYNDNTWHMITLTRYQDEMHLYLDTNSIHTYTIPGGSQTLQTPDLPLLFTGYKHENGTNAFYTRANIGCIHMYRKGLSASEVLHNYNALKGRFGL